MDLPSVVPQSSLNGKVKLQEDNMYGVHNTLVNGFACVRAQMCSPHPIQESEKNFKSNLDRINFASLRYAQGLHAPLRIINERKAAGKVQRLPFLPSSNAMLEALDGSDETIDFTDFLNDPMQPEHMGPPHMVMEKCLGLL